MARPKGRILVDRGGEEEEEEEEEEMCTAQRKGTGKLLFHGFLR